jgi:hypothetical protein
MLVPKIHLDFERSVDNDGLVALIHGLVVKSINNRKDSRRHGRFVAFEIHLLRTLITADVEGPNEL